MHRAFLTSLSSSKYACTALRWSSCSCTFRAVVSQSTQDVNLAANVLFTDESIFQSGRDIQSAQWTFVVSRKSPIFVAPQSRTLLRSKCIGRVGGWLLTRAITFLMIAAKYVFLEQVLPGLLYDSSANVRRNMWFEYVGVPSYNRIFVRINISLSTSFPHRWIKSNGSVCWLSRLPDLSKLDFLLCMVLKTNMYVLSVEFEMDLIARFVYAAFTTIKLPVFEPFRHEYSTRIHHV